MSQVPDLIIPIRMDKTGATQDLQQVRGALDATGKAGQKAGRDIAGGVKQGRDEMGRFTESTKSAESSMLRFIQAQAGLGALKNLAGNLSDQFRATADEIGRASREWMAFRRSLQSVSSLSGQQNSNKFAEAEVARAERAHVTPAEMKDFRDAFLSKASLYIGNGPDAKLNDKDADEFQEYLSEYAKLKGVGQQEMAGFAGGLLAQQKGPTTAAEMKQQAGKVFATLEASSAPVAHLLPMLTRAQAQGFSAEEGSQVLSMMPEIAPEEEGTYLLRAVSALRETTQKGQGEEFGLKKGMTPYQALTTAVENIKRRAAAGEDLDDLLTKATHGEEVSGRALRGLVNQGPEGFARWRRVMEAIPDNQLETTIKEGRASDAGKQYAVDSRLEVERARLGMRNDAVERRRQIAEAELSAGGRFEHPLAMDRAKAMLPFSDDLKTQQINRQAIARARAELGEVPTLGDNAAAQSKSFTDELLRTLIQRIEEQTSEIKKQTKAMDKPEPVRALSAPPPMRGGGWR